MNTKIKGEIDILKKAHKAKLLEVQDILKLDFSVEALLKSNDTGPEVIRAKIHREMIEQAENLLRENKKLEEMLNRNNMSGDQDTELLEAIWERKELQESY